MNPDRESLIHRYFEGLLDEAETARFNELVVGDAEFRARFAKYSYDQSTLRDLLKSDFARTSVPSGEAGDPSGLNSGGPSFKIPAQSMPSNMNLEGSEEDFASLLVHHRIISEEQRQAALEIRKRRGVTAGGIKSLQDELIRAQVVPSRKIFEDLHAASRVMSVCTRCSTEYSIHHYWASSRYLCTACSGLLRIVDPGQSMTWKPGDRIIAPLPAPSPAPVDASGVFPLNVGGETMLDMGSASKAKTGSPAPLPVDASGVFPANVGGETMLDMGNAAKGKASPPPPAESKKSPAESTMTVLPLGGENMLDLSNTKAMPMPAPPPPPPPVLADDASMTMMPAGGDTMLGMGKAGAQAKANPDATMSMIPDGGATMLGMGDNKPTILSKGLELPDVPREGEEGTARRQAVDFVIADNDVTLLDGRGSATGATKMPPPSAMLSGKFEAMQVVQDTPKTAGGGSVSGSSSAAMANAKAIPPDALKAAKDPNRVFGKYILLSELGRGGVGVVYKAWDTLMLQYVALKFIKNQDDDGSGSSESGSSAFDEFQKEARMSLRLRHNNIVRIYEFGSMSNRHYMSMEYIEGGSLLQLIHGKERGQNTRFHSDPEKFIKVMRDICLAVDYAHTSKPPIIHRDLKPHNVLVDTKGTPYVVDFGLAKEVDNQDAATLSGVVKGTPTYMAPEQADGHNKDVDARTDVYALGTIMYEILTGRPPFLGENVPEILRKVSTEIPERPNEVIAKATAAAEAKAGASSTSKSRWSKTKALLVPKPLEIICLKAIEKAKIHRYQSAKELAEDIERFLKNEDILAQEPGPWRRMRRWARRHPITSSAMAAVMLVGITAGIFMNFFQKPDDMKGAKLIESTVEQASVALAKKDWVMLRAKTDSLIQLERSHPKVNLFEKALRDHRDLVEKTEREWSAQLDRVRREPLPPVISGMREIFHRCPELQPKMSEGLRQELVAVQRRVLEESRRLVGSGARPAWVEEIIKQSAREAKEQSEALVSLGKDPDFKFIADAEVPEARDGLARVIEYRGTWTLRVNVAPYAEVRLSRGEKELADDFTPVGLQELEVVGSSYVVELFWPSRQDPKVTIRQEVQNLAHGQTVVIRGDVSKDKVMQERQ